MQQQQQHLQASSQEPLRRGQDTLVCLPSNIIPSAENLIGSRTNRQVSLVATLRRAGTNLRRNVATNIRGRVRQHSNPRWQTKSTIQRTWFWVSPTIILALILPFLTFTDKIPGANELAELNQMLNHAIESNLNDDIPVLYSHSEHIPSPPKTRGSVSPSSDATFLSLNSNDHYDFDADDDVTVNDTATRNEKYIKHLEQELAHTKNRLYEVDSKFNKIKVLILN